jgi:hypothetical protein
MGGGGGDSHHHHSKHSSRGGGGGSFFGMPLGNNSRSSFFGSFGTFFHNLYLFFPHITQSSHLQKKKKEKTNTVFSP